MKQWFMLGLILFVPVGILIALLYSFGRFLVTLVTDWRLYRELDELEAEGEARREKKVQENVERLDNGCDHSFGGAMGFPPDVCAKCGLSKEKPTGACDHVWRRAEGPVPQCYCETCRKQYRPNL